MRRIRVIPILLIDNGRLVKSVKFKAHKYVGDPINAVKIFNDKEVDEIAIIDISATRDGRPPDISLISEISGEAFMPLSYGGGITKIEEVKRILYEGAEKVVINTSALKQPALITSIAKQFGSQSVVASIDVKKNWLGHYKVFQQNGSKSTGLSPIVFAKKMESLGAGEILLNSIDQDGTFQGFDISLIRSVAEAVDIPVIACGGASDIKDLAEAVLQGKASAVAAGSMFVFQRPHRAVLISYPSQNELNVNLFSKLL